jgi:hypothetical protein
MTNDDIIRSVAALAAVALIAAPASASMVATIRGWLTARPRPAAPVAADETEARRLADMRLVLDLAARLKSDGVPEGVALCQQLLDVMLSGSKAKK